MEQLNIFYKESSDLTKGKIDLIEMAGDLMRTPILQKTVQKVTGKDLSKGILIDECPSIGASLYTSLINGDFPIPQFKGISDYNMYSILYTLNGNDKKIYTLIHNGNRLPAVTNIKINQSDIKNNQLICQENNEIINDLLDYGFILVDLGVEKNMQNLKLF